ncbi:MAG: N-acetylneuraminate synthase family protein, partial [Pseudomonadota bacterium]|nr:N-acetylneuraminate synthase family protein [Pseudomonadota bacterium]
LSDEFKVSTGLSDHSLGIEVPIAAVALGAVVIEKHFTLDKTLPGPDHKASLEPAELKAMVQGIRHIELALGTGEKVASKSEQANKTVARKRIVVSQTVKQGEKFTTENITLKRSDQGLFAESWDAVLGQKAPKDFRIGEGVVL